MSYAFFASYARGDRDAYGKLGQVIDELHARVRSKLGANEQDLVGFVDVESILTGEDWQQRLAEAVSQARVLVCFQSPRFFNSEWCAKEFDIFRRRLALVVDRPPRAIIPVVWETGGAAAAMDGIQFKDARLDARYLDNGLVVLKRVKGLRGVYLDTIETLAEIIRESVNHAVPALQPLVPFAELPRAFDNPGRYNVALLALHPRGPQWSFGLAGATIARAIDSVASSLKIPWRDVPFHLDPMRHGELKARLVDAAANREAVIVITEDAIAETEPYRTLLALVEDSQAGVAVFVGASGRADEALLRRYVPKLAASPKAFAQAFSLNSPDELRVKLAQTITRLRGALVEEDPAAKVESSALRNAAEQQGISLDARPLVQGPGGIAA